MTDPRPILEGAPSDAERLLLTSAHHDTPPTDGRARALMALGLAAGVGTATASSSATASTLGPSLIAKWVATGALTGLVVAGSVATIAHHFDARHPVATTPTLPAVNDPPRTTPRAVEAPVEIGTKENTAAAPATRTVHHAATAPTPAPPSQGLSAEIAALDAARQSLAAGAAPRALTLLDAYESSFPARTFAQEASVLRVEALHAAGRDAEAMWFGERLLASAPNSAHAQRLRSLLSSIQSAR